MWQKSYAEKLEIHTLKVKKGVFTGPNTRFEVYYKVKPKAIFLPKESKFDQFVQSLTRRSVTLDPP